MKEVFQKFLKWLKPPIRKAIAGLIVSLLAIVGAKVTGWFDAWIDPFFHPIAVTEVSIFRADSTVKIDRREHVYCARAGIRITPVLVDSSWSIDITSPEVEKFLQLKVENQDAVRLGLIRKINDQCNALRNRWACVMFIFNKRGHGVNLENEFELILELGNDSKEKLKMKPTSPFPVLVPERMFAWMSFDERSQLIWRTAFAGSNSMPAYTKLSCYNISTQETNLSKNYRITAHVNANSH